MGDSPTKRPAVQRGLSTVSANKTRPALQRVPSTASGAGSGGKNVQRAVSSVSSRSGDGGRPLSGGEFSLQSGGPPAATPIPQSLGKRVWNCLSHAVIIVFLAFYSLAGGVMFVYLERPHEEAVQHDTRVLVNYSRDHLVGRIWNYTRENVVRPCLLLHGTEAGGAAGGRDGFGGSGGYSAIRRVGGGSAGRRRDDVSEEEALQAARQAREDLMRAAEAGVRAVLAEELSHYERVLYEAADNGVYVHDEPDYNWNYPRAMFFSATVITTIGYGNIAPVTTSGRVFCIVYAFLGIPVTLIAIGDMGKLFAEFVKFVYKKAKTRIAANRKRRAEAAAVKAAAEAAARPHTQTAQQQHNQNGAAAQPEPEVVADVPTGPSTAQTSLRVLGAMALLVLYIALGGGLFILWEKWTFFESFYFCFITMTTIGLGDVVPEHQMFMLLCTVYILIGLALTSTCIELARSEYEKSWQRMVEASKRLNLSGGINLADTLRRIGDQIEQHGEIVDLGLLADLKSAITGVPHDPDDDDRPPPVLLYETSV